MKKIAFTSIAMLFLILSPCLSGVFAQTRSPGVAVGDSFKYTYTLDMNINGTLPAFPELFQQLVEQAKSVEWIQLTITSVSGTTVSSNMVMHYKNGTEQTSQATTDVATGQGDLDLFIIAKNLSPNDPIHQDSQEKINETITKNFGSNTRELNHQQVEMEYTVSKEESGLDIEGPLQQSNTQSIYWDKKTGVLTEMSMHMKTRSEQINADITLNLAIIQSSIFTIPEYPTLAIIVLALAIPTIAALVIKKRNQQSPHIL